MAVAVEEDDNPNSDSESEGGRGWAVVVDNSVESGVTNLSVSVAEVDGGELAVGAGDGG